MPVEINPNKRKVPQSDLTGDDIGEVSGCTPVVLIPMMVPMNKSGSIVESINLEAL